MSQPTRTQTTNNAAPREDAIYPAYALAEPVAGVRFAENPDLDAPQRHRLINPHVPVRLLVAHDRRYRPQTLTLMITPAGDGTPTVVFDGGPRAWWDTDAGCDTFDTSLQRLTRISAATRSAGFRDMIAAQAQETYGRRALTVASVRYRPRGVLGVPGRGRVMLSLQVGYGARDGVLSWEDPHTGRRVWGSDRALVDPGELYRALKALGTAAEAAEPVKVGYSAFRATR